MVLPSIIQPEAPSRATENYPQSCRAAQVVRVPRSAMGRSRDQDRHRDSDRAAGQRPGKMFGLRPGCAWVRPPGRASVRVRPAVADRRLLCLRDASGRMPDLWREGGAGSLVRRQAFVDDDLSLVSGRLGKAPFLERGGRGLWHDVAERVSLGKTCGVVGFGTPQLGEDRVDRRGRGAVATRPQVPDAGLSDRRRAEASVVDRPGSHRQDLLAVLSHAGQRALRENSSLCAATCGRRT